jgi:predicted nucleic acid-binding protein
MQQSGKRGKQQKAMNWPIGFAVDSSSGLLDTNILIHSITRDEHSTECSRFLDLVSSGEVRARLEPVVVHELTYALPRYTKQLTRQDVATMVVNLIELPGIEADTELLKESVLRWAATPGLGFVDAYLAAIANREDRIIYTKNVRELVVQGAVVPNPLPGPVST